MIYRFQPSTEMLKDFDWGREEMEEMGEGHQTVNNGTEPFYRLFLHLFSMWSPVIELLANSNASSINNFSDRSFLCQGKL